jgi:hypothetical protein
MKKNWNLILALGIGLILTITGVMGISKMMVTPSSVSAATTATVSVSATVQEWLSISVSPTSATLTPDMVDTSGNTYIASSSDITITTGTNHGTGYNLQINENDNNGLASGSYYIDNPTATTTVTAGTDAYGAQATSTVTTIAANYNYWGTNVVGDFELTAQNLATKSSPGSGETTTMKLKAACDSTQPAGTYTDTITLTIVAAP